MDAWLDFGRGPLFRVSFALMVFGLVRLLVLTAVNMTEAYRRSPDKILPWRDLTLRTLSWLIPFGALWRKRPLYGTISVLFHVGLLTVPPLLAAHALLWERAVGYSWPSMSQGAANWLTLLMIVTGLALLAGRLLHAGARSLSRRQDYLWPLLLLLPFSSGYICSNAGISPRLYESMMLIHVYSADLVMLLVPFTKIAHCVLLPVSHFVSGFAWKFPAGAGERVAATLGYADRPTWLERPRVAVHTVDAPTEEA